MAFDITKFGQADSTMNSTLPRVYVYSTVDTAATVDTSGYFNTLAGVLKVGDVIQANVDTDGTPGYGRFLVASNAAGVVDVADLDAYATTDTD